MTWFWNNQEKYTHTGGEIGMVIYNSKTQVFSTLLDCVSLKYQVPIVSTPWLSWAIDLLLATNRISYTFIPEQLSSPNFFLLSTQTIAPGTEEGSLPAGQPPKQSGSMGLNQWEVAFLWIPCLSVSHICHMSEMSSRHFLIAVWYYFTSTVPQEKGLSFPKRTPDVW